MKNFAVICFFVVGTAVLLVQEISGYDEFWYEEVSDVEKRQTWNAFYNKHVFEASSTNKDDKFWNKIARKRLGRDYGVRPFNTFIQVENKDMITSSFIGRLKCSNGYFKSDKMFALVEMTWNAATKKYVVNYPGLWYICVKLDRNGLPIHFEGKSA